MILYREPSYQQFGTGIDIDEHDQKSTIVDIQDPLRFQEKHFPAVYISDKSKSQNPMRRCAMCSKKGKRRTSRYYCKQCNVGLCVVPCFELYHTQQ